MNPPRRRSCVAETLSLPARGEGEGFTLVELLVGIGIIAILMALLLPSLRNAREQSRSLACLSNLREMMHAAAIYQSGNGGRFPIAVYSVNRAPIFINYGWDFIETRDTSTGVTTIEPGTLWWGNATLRVQQCPSFDGKSVGYANDPFTGYNYNTSYIGREMLAGVLVAPPAKASQIRHPSRTAVFGDGEYAIGANKFMRSPFPAPGEPAVARYAGTQGFRHRGRTNVAFADGHAESMPDRFTTSTTGDMPKIAPRTGFLSADNSLYDLD